ncbi:unnamed protein product [Brassica rapa subsp. narinosa]
MFKQQCSSMEPLHHDVVERIMEMLPVKSLLRFKGVSKQWQSTIKSRYFQERQLNHREQSRDPDVLMVCIHSHDVEADTSIESLRTLVLGSLSSVKIPTSWENTLYSVCRNTCDGFQSIVFEFCFVVNPATRWHRTLPRCHFQQNRSILGTYKVGFDGKLHWFTQCKETKVLSLDLHTENFQVISNVPFANVDP